MITTDRAKRDAKLTQLLETISAKAHREDRDLLLQFAPVVFAETPDRIALSITPEALSERIYRHFRFVTREIPPAAQLYRGVPGIHVSVYNPDETTSNAIGEGGDLPSETTVVETHTVDAPFIFDSLKNYFSRAGLRVFSAIHPIFTVRRQWERVVWMGGPHDEGSKEVYCHFQIEPVDSKERLRRMEHEIFSVLKCVFLAVEDFRRMLKVVAETGARLRSRRGDERELNSARAFLDWLLDENYIFLGAARYRPGPNGTCERDQDSIQGVFSDSDLLPIVFPGLIEELESHIIPQDGDDGIIGLDYCRNASAIYHLEPIDSIVLREWGPDGSLRGATLVLGRFARGTFVQRADRIPLLQEKIDLILSDSNALPNSHLYREIRNIFSRLPMRELFYAPPASLKAIIEPIVFMMGDDEIAIQCRKGAGYVALSIAFSRLRYSYIVEQSLTRALSSEFGPVSFRTAAECGAVSLILFYFDADRLEHPIEPEAVRRIARPLVTTWEAQVEHALENAFGEREGRRLFQKYVRIDTRSGLYREVTSPQQVPDDIKHLENLESRLEVQIVPKSAETSALRLYSLRALGLTETLRTLQNLGIQVTDEMLIPLVLPGGRRCYLYRLEISADAGCISELRKDGDRFIDALRAVEEERLTNDRLNGLILKAGLGWRQVELLRTVRNHLLQIRPHYNVETVNGVLLRNHAVAGALYWYFKARFDPAVTDRRAEMTSSESAVQEALVSV